MKISDKCEALEARQPARRRLAPHLRIVEVDFLKPSNRNDHLEQDEESAPTLAQDQLTE